MWDFRPNCHVQLFCSVPPDTDPAGLVADYDGPGQLLVPPQNFVVGVDPFIPIWRPRLIVPPTQLPSGDIYITVSSLVANQTSETMGLVRFLADDLVNGVLYGQLWQIIDVSLSTRPIADNPGNYTIDAVFLALAIVNNAPPFE